MSSLSPTMLNPISSAIFYSAFVAPESAPRRCTSGTCKRKDMTGLTPLPWPAQEVKAGTHRQLCRQDLKLGVICEGNQATLQFKQTVSFFQPLFKSLKRKSVLPEMVAGLDMIVEDIKQRNYLHAYDIYMRLAIGKRSPLLGACSVSMLPSTLERLTPRQIKAWNICMGILMLAAYVHMNGTK